MKKRPGVYTPLSYNSDHFSSQGKGPSFRVESSCKLKQEEKEKARQMESPDTFDSTNSNQVTSRFSRPKNRKWLTYSLIPASRKNNTGCYSDRSLDSFLKYPEDSYEPTIPKALSYNELDVSECLIKARESLYELRCEVKGYARSAKRKLRDFQKPIKSKTMPEFLQSYFLHQTDQSLLKELSESVQNLKCQMLINEQTAVDLISSKETLEKSIACLEVNVSKYHSLKIETTSMFVNCTNKCQIF